ncbi:hypothetical protein JCM8097_003489 [Rhodosporidiobolus ruineniae]
MPSSRRSYGTSGGRSIPQAQRYEDESDEPASTFRSLAKRYSPAPIPLDLPRQSYLRDLDEPSHTLPAPPQPKARLLVSDLDNTLFGPSGDGVVARPFLATFLKYIMHRDTPYNLAIWTFSGRQYGIAHLRQVGMGKYLFNSDSLSPKFKPELLALWGYEDSGFLRNGQMAAGQPLKDLDLMWDFINVAHGEEYGPSNSLLVDDQAPNARAQPDSLVKAPVFTSMSPDDDFLLAFIGVLEELAQESNIASAIAADNLYDGIASQDVEHYIAKARNACKRLGIRVSRGLPYCDNSVVESVKQSQATGPTHEPVDETAGQSPSPLSQPLPAEVTAAASFSRPKPKRLAQGMLTGPSPAYLAEAAIPSKVGRVKGRRLICFDFDGTLYTRPPQNLEHDPNGEPAGRPYLLTFLRWLFRPESPWDVAIWTGSQKATAVRCLYELDLGLLVAVWAREDLGLTPKDYRSYVEVVKDLDKLWDYLRQAGYGSFSPATTVHVDDTPSKLRGQPFNLIAAPTFDYPLAPSPATTTALLDTFLLSLVGMLDALEPESNFADALEELGWGKVQSDEVRQGWMKRGLRILRQDGVPIAAEGRGPVEGVMPSKNGTGKSMAVQIFRPTSRSAAPLTASALSRLPSSRPTPSGNNTDVASDTDNASTSSSSSSTSASSASSTDAKEEEDKKKDEEAKKEDWENLSDDPDAEPVEVPSPYYQAEARRRGRR